MEIRPILIIGGAGFIGSNLAFRLAGEKRPVIVFDSLSAPGSRENLFRLASLGQIVKPVVADIRNSQRLREAVRSCGAVFHLSFASESAINDESVNVQGTLRLLEELRAMDKAPPLIYASTSEVYGDLSGVEMYVKGSRYEPSDEWIAAKGIPADQPVEPRTPYICSRLSAESYVLDYANSFGLKTTVLRLFDVYGTDEFADKRHIPAAVFMKDFLKGALVLRGDGMHVRDLLHIEDLCDALVLSLKKIERLSGSVFNIGGGPDNALSELELAGLVASFYARVPEIVFRGSRERRYSVSDNSKFRSATGWSPGSGVKEGIRRLYLLFNGRTQPAKTPRLRINEIYSNKP